MIAARGSLRISAFGGLRSGLTAFRLEAKNDRLKRSAPQTERRGGAECSYSVAILKFL